MTPLLTVAYLTFRENPKFEWFNASLSRELRDTPDVPQDAVQIIVIDGRHPRKLEADFPFEHFLPKPTVWQGPHRLTQRDYFCAANTRNTVFALARAPHVAFVDDLSVLLPGWLKAHLHAATNGYMLCGTTCKRKNIELNAAGSIVRYDDFPPGTDSRMRFLETDELVACTGSWLYGGTFSLPLEHALRVNGQDEICDTIGGEDYDFGERLERSGSRIFISRACGTLEDEEGHHNQTAVIRLDKPWPPAATHKPRTLLPGRGSAGSDGSGWDTADGVGAGPYSSNYLLDRLRQEPSRIWTLGNTFNLRELRERVLTGNPFPIPIEPITHWVDGQLLNEM